MSPEMQNIVIVFDSGLRHLLAVDVPVCVQCALAPEESGERHRDAAAAGGEEEREPTGKSPSPRS